MDGLSVYDGWTEVQDGWIDGTEQLDRGYRMVGQRAQNGWTESIGWMD